MSVWKTVIFENLYAIPSRNGVSKPKRVRGEGFKMVNMGELFAFDRISNQDMERVPLTERERRLTMLEKGDLLFARQSLVREGAGKCSIIMDTSEPTTYESHLIRVRLNKEITSPLFYFYYFNSHTGKASVQSLVMQVAAAGIRGSDLQRLNLPLPPLTIQQKIVSVLSAYDELIENNIYRIRMLEETAQTLFREWFIEYRYPGHENAGKVDSELGLIPKGWNIGAVTDFIEINPALSLPKNVAVPYLPMANLSESSMIIDTSSLEYRTKGSGTKFQNNDTLLARITPSLENGKTGFVQFLTDDNSIGIGSTEFYVMRSSKLPPEYVYLFSRVGEFRDAAAKSMVGASGRQRVQKAFFDEHYMLCPDDKTLKQFSEYTSPIFQEVYLLNNSNQCLRQIRDKLLPRLVSGEIDVADLDVR